jgi:hypothetical protein
MILQYGAAVRAQLAKIFSSSGHCSGSMRHRWFRHVTFWNATRTSYSLNPFLANHDEPHPQELTQILSCENEAVQVLQTQSKEEPAPTTPPNRCNPAPPVSRQERRRRERERKKRERKSEFQRANPYREKPFPNSLRVLWSVVML